MNYSHDVLNDGHTHWFYFDFPNCKGEKVTVEMHKAEFDNNSTLSLAKHWYKAGKTGQLLSSYWAVTTYVTKQDGTCYGGYNPTYEYPYRDANGRVCSVSLNFDWVMEATEENMMRLLKEVYKRAFQDSLQEVLRSASDAAALYHFGGQSYLSPANELAHGEISIRAKNTDRKTVHWFTAIWKETDGWTVRGSNTDYLNIWLCETRKKDLTADQLANFFSELNRCLGFQSDGPIRLSELVDPEDWQQLSGVEDAHSDPRYTTGEETPKFPKYIVTHYGDIGTLRQVEADGQPIYQFPGGFRHADNWELNHGSNNREDLVSHGPLYRIVQFDALAQVCPFRHSARIPTPDGDCVDDYLCANHQHPGDAAVPAAGPVHPCSCALCPLGSHTLEGDFSNPLVDTNGFEAAEIDPYGPEGPQHITVCLNDKTSVDVLNKMK